MKKSLKWRLSSLPTPEEVRGLVQDRLITKDEARAVLFSEIDEVQERDKKSLESEVKFLRSIIEKLAPNTSKIIETIRVVEKPYFTQPWYQPYQLYCTNTNSVVYTTGTVSGGGGGGTSALNLNLSAQAQTAMGSSGIANGFSNIKTF